MGVDGQQTGGEKNVQQNVGKLDGGTVIGQQHIYHTPPPAPQAPKGMSDGVKIALIGGFFTLVAAAIAIIPGLLEERRGQASQDAAATAFAVMLSLTAPLNPTLAPTETLAPPSATPAPTDTSALTDKASETSVCQATIRGVPGVQLNVVRNLPPPSLESPAAPVATGEVVPITAGPIRHPMNDTITIWYQIVYNNGKSQGWVSLEHLSNLSPSCPQ